MSTRCEVILKHGDKSLKLYHHHDGYINGVGFDLLERFREKLDTCRPYALSISDFANILVKDQNDEYEISMGNHDDIEYQYTIDIDKKEITAVHGDWWDRYDNPEIFTFYSYDGIKKIYDEEK